jgi:hypothetical protein
MSTFTSDGTENHMRWDRRSRDFMEVWYATLNHKPTNAGLWIRYTLTAPRFDDPYCELWAFLFDPAGVRTFAGKQRFPIDHLAGPHGRDDGALVRIGDAWLSENHLEGEVVGNDGSLAWSLDFAPADRTFQHLPAGLRRRVERRVSTVCSPNLSVPFGGTVKLDGDLLEFDGEVGSQSHRWGRRHSGSWSWAHCSDFARSEGTIFEGVAARASVGRVALPTTTFLYLRHEDEDIAFNDLRGSLRAKSRYVLPTWAFTANTDKWRIVGAARFQIPNAVQVEYADPDGTPRYCANSEIADLGIELYGMTSSGWRHHASLTSLGGAHLEFGRRQRFPELKVAF